MSTAGSTGDGGAPASTGGAPSTGMPGSTGMPSSTGAAAIGWGDDWRTRMAGGNADEAKRLERFQGPENVFRSYRELESRVSSGELRPMLKKDATAEEIKRWRTDWGIPETAQGYKVNAPQGVDIKADDAFLNAFLTRAHAANYTQAQVDEAIASYYAEVDRQIGAIGEDEAEAERRTEDQLCQEWAADYRTHKALAESLLSRAPADFVEKFRKGYLSDHTPIRASPEMWKWLVQLEREINPAATVLPGASGDLGKTIEGELTELRKQMSAPKGSPEHDKYWKQGGEARYRELLEAQAKMKERSAAAH